MILNTGGLSHKFDHLSLATDYQHGIDTCFLRPHFITLIGGQYKKDYVAASCGYGVQMTILHKVRLPCDSWGGG